MSFLKSTQIVQLKRTAQNVHSKRVQRDKISKQITELQEKLTEINEEIEAWETPIRRMTGGFTTEDLIERVVEDTGKLDKTGNPVKVTKYILKYPETIIPGEAENPEGSSGTIYDPEAYEPDQPTIPVNTY